MSQMYQNQNTVMCGLSSLLDTKQALCRIMGTNFLVPPSI